MELSHTFKVTLHSRSGESIFWENVKPKELLKIHRDFRKQKQIKFREKTMQAHNTMCLEFQEENVKG